MEVVTRSSCDSRWLDRGTKSTLLVLDLRVDANVTRSNHALIQNTKFLLRESKSTLDIEGQISQYDQFPFFGGKKQLRVLINNNNNNNDRDLTFFLSTLAYI